MNKPVRKRPWKPYTGAVLGLLVSLPFVAALVLATWDEAVPRKEYFLSVAIMGFFMFVGYMIVERRNP